MRWVIFRFLSGALSDIHFFEIDSAYFLAFEKMAEESMVPIGDMGFGMFDANG